MSIPLTIATMNNGGVLEAIDEGLRVVAENIGDVNTPPDKVRELNIKIKFKPDESRTLIATNVVVTPKVQPQEAQNISVVLDKVDNKPALFECFADSNPLQLRIEGTDIADIRALSTKRSGVENVTPFKTANNA